MSEKNIGAIEDEELEQVRNTASTSQIIVKKANYVTVAQAASSSSRQAVPQLSSNRNSASLLAATTADPHINSNKKSSSIRVQQPDEQDSGRSFEISPNSVVSKPS